jgi:hypothetical protein
MVIGRIRPIEADLDGVAEIGSFAGGRSSPKSTIDHGRCYCGLVTAVSAAEGSGERNKAANGSRV